MVASPNSLIPHRVSSGRVLVAGWFSFEEMGATAGDLITRDLVRGWLAECGRDVDVALAHPFTGGVDWRAVDPSQYSHVVFVCGPVGNGPPLAEFLERFSGRHLTGVNLTMLDSLEEWNPFDLLLERDSSRTARPDLAILGPEDRVPLVGVVLIHPQPEYRERDLHRRANDAILHFLDSIEAARIHIDTRLDVNGTGLRSAREIESVISRMDVVLTTRLHGLVLSLKNGVPVVAVDPVAGGAKITRQARQLGWTALLAAEDASDATLGRAIDYCLTPDARRDARAARDRAAVTLAEVRTAIMSTFGRT